MKQFLALYMLCFVPILGYNEELIVPTNDGKEMTLNMNEVILLGENIEACDLAWKHGLLQQAWDYCCILEEQVTKPLLLSGIFLRKALIAHELRWRQKSDQYFLSFMKCVHQGEVDRVSEENRKEFEEKIIETGRSQVSTLKGLIFSMYKNKERERIISQRIKTH